jgi:hypothetical protein
MPDESLAPTYDIARVEQARALINEDSPADLVREVLSLGDGMYDRAKRIRDGVHEAVREWCEKNGELQLGGKVYYSGIPKTVKCRDVARTLRWVLIATGKADQKTGEFEHDIEAAAQYLASGAWKYGACAKLLPPQLYDECFETTYPPKLLDKDTSKKLLTARVEVAK